MYSDKVEVLRFETEPYKKHLNQNDSPFGNPHTLISMPSYKYAINNNNNNISNGSKNVNYKNGYHNTLIEKETRRATTTTSTTTTKTGGKKIVGSKQSVSFNSTTASLNSDTFHLQSPSDPVIASLLHSRQIRRPGRLLLENVNDRPQTMDRGTQANTEDAAVEAPPPQSTSNDPTGSEMYRNANISVTNQKLMTNGGDNSSVDSLNSADSTKRDSEESVIELAEFNQPMISKDNIDGHINMNNGDGKAPGVGKSNGNVKEHPVDDEIERTSCGMECLYFAMQCCECSIM